MKPTGNRVLVEHGIQTERADYRAHVCPVVRQIYFFCTDEMRRLVSSGRYLKRSAYIEGIETARGNLVPVEDVCTLQAVCMPMAGWAQLRFCETDSLSAKGKKAIHAVSWVLRKGLVMLPWKTGKCPVSVDIAGADMVVTGAHFIQVKCDYMGGAKSLGGTGNLYIQTMECNPFGLY